MPVKKIIAFIIAHFAVITMAGQNWERVDYIGKVEERAAGGFISCKGFFYLIGGYGQPATNVFDPGYNAWFELTPPPVEMHHFQAVRHEETIIIAGAFTGRGAAMRPLENVWIFHTDSNLWEKGPEIPKGRARGAAAAQVFKGDLYLVGGNVGPGTGTSVAWVDRLDLRELSWKSLPDAPRAREQFHAAVINGRLYVAGGKRKIPGGGMEQPIAEVDVLNLERNRWNSLPAELNLPTPRMGTASVAILDHFLVIGGKTEQGAEASRKVEAFDVENQRWLEWGMLNKGRFESQAFMCVGTVHIASLTQDGKLLPAISMETLVFD